MAKSIESDSNNIEKFIEYSKTNPHKDNNLVAYAVLSKLYMKAQRSF